MGFGEALRLKRSVSTTTLKAAAFLKAAQRVCCPVKSWIITRFCSLAAVGEATLQAFPGVDVGCLAALSLTAISGDQDFVGEAIVAAANFVEFVTHNGHQLAFVGARNADGDVGFGVAIVFNNFGAS